MADPTTTGGGIAWAAAAGLFGAFFAAVGVSPGALLLAMFGALIGSGFAPQIGRLRAICMFPASTVIAAKAGIATAAAVIAIGGLTGEALAQALAGGFGVFLHPLIAAIARFIPQKLGVRE